mgnify:CR=1 FL=1
MKDPLTARVAREGGVRTESHLAALEKAKADKGEAPSATDAVGGSRARDRDGPHRGVVTAIGAGCPAWNGVPP